MSQPAGAGEHLNLFALAILKGLQVSDLKDVIYAYLTQVSNAQYPFP